MSTRSNIALELEGGSFKVIYCHNDGYVDGGVGELLYESYQERSKVEQLISLGDISFLGPVVDSPDSEFPEGTAAYARDRGEDYEQNKARIYTQEAYDDMLSGRDRYIPYVYVYDLEGVWTVYHDGKKAYLEDALEDPEVLF